MSLANSIEITIKCPKCRKTLKKRISDINRNPNHRCTCGTTLDLREFKPLGNGISNIDDALKKLRF